MNLCQVRYYLNPFAPLYMDTYEPDDVVARLKRLGIEAEVVLNGNYLPASLQDQAI